MKFLNNLNLNKNQIQNALMHPLAVAPGSPKEGQMYYNTNDKKLYYYNGTAWIGLNDIDLSEYAKKTDIGNGTLTIQKNGSDIAPTFSANQASNVEINIELTKADVGLNKVENLSPSELPVSSATQDALNTKLDKVTDATDRAQLYAKSATGAQAMMNVSTTLVNGAVIARDTSGRAQVATGVADNDIVNVAQLKAAIKESDHYYVDLGDDVSIQIPVEDIKKLAADKNSYVLYNGGKYIFQRIENNILYYETTDYDNANGDNATYVYVLSIDSTAAVETSFDSSGTQVEVTSNKVDVIDSTSLSDTKYPTTNAVNDYATGKFAPKSHASSATTYGVGTTTNYGHVKLVTGDMNGKANADGQVPSLNHTHGQYATIANPSFTGNVTIGGNLTVNGTTTTIESSTLQVKDKLIEVAHGNTTKLTSPAGLVVPKYDGTNSGALVFDGDGIAYVGDVVLNANGDIDVAQSDLQALAARAKNIVNGNIVKWDSTTQTFIDAGIAASDLATVDDIPTNYVSTTATEQQVIKSSLKFGEGGINYTIINGPSIQVQSGNTSTDYQNGKIVYNDTNTLTFPTKSGTIALTSDIPSIPTNYVTTNTAQTISGAKTFTGNVILSNTLQAGTSIGTFGQVLVSNGADAAPTWQTLTIPQGTVQKLTSTITGDGTKTSFNITNSLATTDCTVSIYTQVSGSIWEMVMTDVTVSTSAITIYFAQAPASGQSFRVVVTG